AIWLPVTTSWSPARPPAGWTTPRSCAPFLRCCSAPARCRPTATAAQCRRRPAPSPSFPLHPPRPATAAVPVRLPAHEPDPSFPAHRLADGGDVVVDGVEPRADRAPHAAAGGHRERGAAGRPRRAGGGREHSF